MAIPQRINPEKLDDYLEIMTRAVFQAGLSWSIVENKWTGFRKAFKNFDVAKVARFTAEDVERLSQDESILRSKKKIAATVDNARIMLDLDKQHGGFRNYLRSFASYDALSADMRKRFKFFGELSVYYLLFLVGEKVPPFEPWVETIAGDHPRMREMVEQGKPGKPGKAGKPDKPDKADKPGKKNQKKA